MSRPTDASQKPNRRRTIGLRTLLFLYSAVLIGLATLGALGVVIAYRHRAEEDTSRLVLRAARSKAEWETRNALGHVEDFLLIARDWFRDGPANAANPEALAPALAPLLARQHVFGAIRLVASGSLFEMTPSADGWVSSGTQAMDGASEPGWFTAAVALCRARDDDNMTGEPDIAWLAPEDNAEAVPSLMVAMAFGGTAQEVCIAIEVSLQKLADVFVGLFPTPEGVTAVLLDSGHVLGLTGFRYGVNQDGKSSGAILVRDAGNAELARAYAYWSSNRGDGVFEMNVDGQVVWASFRELILGKNGKVVVGAVTPREDVTLLMQQTEEDVLFLGLWGLAAAAVLAWIVGAVLRRPLLVLADHLSRRDAIDAGQRYWPRTRVTEIRDLMAAVDAMSQVVDTRAPVRPAPKPAAAARIDADVPDAQLQALYAARKELRDTKAHAVELQRGLHAIEEQVRETARRAEEQREKLRALSRAEAFRSGDLAGMTAVFTAAAAASLGVARASVWKCEEDGVFLCLDRYDAAEGKHSSGAMLSRAEHRELVDAMQLDPAVGLADLSAERWMQRFAAALGASPAADAVLACAIRSARGIAAMTIFEHTGGVRAWSADEENQAIILSQLLTPAFQEMAPATATPGPSELTAKALTKTQALWLLNADGKVTWVSESMLEWIGKTDTQAIGCLLFEFLDGMEAAPISRAWQTLREGAPHARVEAALERPDSPTRHLRVDLAAWRRADGAFQGAAGLATDLTQLREAELAARNAEAAGRALLNQIPAVVWTADATGRLTYVNAAARQLYGHAPETLIGKSFEVLADGAGKQADLARITDIGRADLPIRWFSAHQRADGTVFDVQVTARVLCDESKKQLGAAGFILPVDEYTELANAGHLLRFLRARDEYIVLGVDRNGTILWLSASPELQERYENDLRDMMGQTLLHYFRSQRIEEQIETFRRAAESHTVSRSVFAAQFAGGSYEQEAIYIPLPEEGETNLVLVFIRDVTASTS